MADIERQIAIFIDKIKAKYPSLKIGYTFDADENYYYIWHTDAHLQFEDDTFPVFIGGLLKEYFYSKDIFNFSFGYDYWEDEKSKLVYEFNSNYNEITININVIEQKITHDPNIYKTIKDYSSSNWPKLVNINLYFDSQNLSFFNQSIRQAKLPKEVSLNLVEQTEKAVAA